MNPLSCILILTLLRSFLAQDEYYSIAHQQHILKPYHCILSSLEHQNLHDYTALIQLLYADALYKGANIYRRLATEKSLSKAQVYHHQTLTIRLRHLPPLSKKIADSYRSLGATYNELKGHDNNKQAITYYQQALSIYKELALIADEAALLNNLANAYRDLDTLYIPQAIDYQQKALALLATIPDSTENRQEQGKMIFNQGKNYYLLGGKNNALHAISLLQNAYTLFVDNNDQARQAITLSYLGEVYISLGNVYAQQAIACLEKALALQRALYPEENYDIQQTKERLAQAYALTSLV